MTGKKILNLKDANPQDEQICYGTVNTKVGQPMTINCATPSLTIIDCDPTDGCSDVKARITAKIDVLHQDAAIFNNAEELVISDNWYLAPIYGDTVENLELLTPEK